MSGYYLDCLDEKYSKKVQLFDKLEDFRDNLIKELDYIEHINENVFNYEIDMSTFDQKEFDNVKVCKYCDDNFDKSQNGKQITLTGKVDKYKLKRIIDDFGNNNINGKYYSHKFSLQNMFNEVRSSIIHTNCLDVDFKNSIVTIIIYLSEKHNLKIPNTIKYSKDRENILKQINNDRMTVKKTIITILNGGFSNKYHYDKNINKFLKNILKNQKCYMNIFIKLIKE